MGTATREGAASALCSERSGGASARGRRAGRWPATLTGASALILVAAMVAASVALVTFVFTTLINEPASMVALLVILALSVALDVGWKWGHGDRSARTDQFGHSATA